MNVIKYNGLYFKESDTYGQGYFIKDRDNATNIIDYNDAINYCKELDITVESITFVRNEIPYKYHNGTWYNLETHFICDECDTIHCIKNANYINGVNGKQEICYRCYDTMDLDDFEDITLDEYNLG